MKLRNECPGWTAESFVVMSARSKHILDRREEVHEKSFPEKGTSKTPGRRVFGSTISEITPEDRMQQRSGAIIYTTTSSGSIVFIAGVDTESGDITDFGGQRSPYDRDAIVTGLRELTEESLGVFGSISPDEVESCYAIYSKRMMIMFIYIDLDVALVNSTFDFLRIKKLSSQQPSTSKYEEGRLSLEVKRLAIMSFDELKSNIYQADSKMYSVVRVFLRRYIAGLRTGRIEPDNSFLEAPVNFDREFENFRSHLLHMK